MLEGVYYYLKRSSALGLVCALLSVTGNAEALKVQVDRGLEAIRSEKWAEAVEVFGAVEGKLEDGDPRKGVILYHLGFCRLKQAIEVEVGSDKEEAVKLLEAAAVYLKMSSEVGSRGNAVNIYERRALLQLGVVRQKQGEYELAIARYEEFLLKRDQLRDVYDRGVLLVNMAICYASKEESDLARARALFLEAASGKVGERLAGKDFMRGFVVIVERGMDEADRGGLLEWFNQVDEIYVVKAADEAEWGKLIMALVYDASEKKVWDVGLGLLAFDLKVVPAELGEIVYRMVRVAGLSEEPEVVLKLAARYLELFENGSYRKEVLVMEVEAYRKQGRYDRMAEVAKTHDELEGGQVYLLEAYYFGGKYEDALKLSRSIREKETDDVLKRKVLFFEGASLSRLHFWKEAGNVLDRYLGSEGKLEYRGLAGYERAVVYRELGETEKAVELLEAILREDEELILRGFVYNLLGNIQQSKRDRVTAEWSYRKALESARTSGHDELEQESLFYLIEMLGQEYVGSSINSAVSEVLPYVDDFLKKYTGSKYAAQVMVAAFPAMRDAGRLEEYLKVVEPMLIRFAESDRTPGLDLAVNSYARALQASGKSMKEVRSILLREGQSRRVSAVMRDGLATIYSGLSERAWETSKVGKAMRYESLFVATYSEFWNGWSAGDMPPYVAMNVAGYLADHGGEMRRVREFYDEVRVRGILSEQIQADLGLGGLLVGAGEDLEDAQRLLKEVILRDEYGGKAREEAYLFLGQYLKGAAYWKKLEKLSREYLDDDRQNVTYRAEFAYFLALSAYYQDKIDDAIVLYGRIYASHLNKIEVSALAVRDLIELTWERNLNRDQGEKADRQVAYRLGQRYISMTRKTFETRRSGLAEEAVKAWLGIEKSVSLWEKSGDVKTVEELLEDRRRGRKSF